MRRVMSFVLSMVLSIVLGLGLSLIGSLASVSPAGAVETPAARLAGEDPAGFTPHVLDGEVRAIAQVGGSILLGGEYERASEAAGGAELSRTNLLAFDAATGGISTTFLPQPDGKVNAVVPAGDGESVYVAGQFRTIGGLKRKNVARVRVSDGFVYPGFDAGPINGQVKDASLAGGRLWLAGGFSSVGGNDQSVLATVDATTGAFDAFMGLAVTGVHNGGSTNIMKIDTTGDGDQLVAIGNFLDVDAERRDQVFMLDLSGPQAELGPFHTTYFEYPCYPVFNTYMRDLDISPDGSYVVLSTTGGGKGPDAACDTTSRFEMDSGANSTPSWTDTTGGDTSYAVEITPDGIVYVGGHFRWQNNPEGIDRPRAGAVERTGIAALWGVNGLPLSWNPTRTRGVGVFDMLHTDQGLWVGSDTDRIGDFEYHGRIALMPSGGSALAAESSIELPNTLYTAGDVGAAGDPSVLHRVNAGGPAQAAAAGIDWSADTSATPSPFHNQVSNRASSGAVPSVDASVPAGTPRALFDTELWDPSGGAEQSWDFPVEAGVPVEVRLYFANRCSCTNDAGERIFHVDVEGTRALDGFDIVAAAGDQTGTMRSVEVTSDGTIDIDLTHVVQNPLLNAVEIVRTDLGPPATPPSTLVARSYDDGVVGGQAEVPTTIDWSAVRGTFMLNGQVYYGTADGDFERRSFDGETFADPLPVDTHDQLAPLEAWHDDVRNVRAMAYDHGRVYFTRAGSNQLFYRFFAAESDVVGASRAVASGSIPDLDFSTVTGLVISDDTVLAATADGKLLRADWARSGPSGAPVPGTVSQVSGPGVDDQRWSSRALFAYQDADGQGADPGGGDPVAQPTARIEATCTDLTCDLDGSGSTVDGGQIAEYAWDFGDGTTASGPIRSHTYASAGQWSVTLTVTTTDGGRDTATRTVTTQLPPQEEREVSFVDSASSAGNRRAHTTTVPATVQAGDTLVAFYTVNSPSATITDPAGWTRLQAVDGNRVQGLAWTRTATAADAGSAVTVGTDVYAKSALAVAAYRASDGPSGVRASAVALENPSGTEHVTPQVSSPASGSWLVSVWSEKSAGTHAWTLPTAVTLREAAEIDGGGSISMRLTDSAGPVPTGAAGGLTATTPDSVSRAVMFSVLLGVA